MIQFEGTIGKCFMPGCPNRGKELPVIEVDIGDETGAVLRDVCADCINLEP